MSRPACLASALTLALLCAASSSAQDHVGGNPQLVRVDCTRGQTLARALERSERSRLRIEFQGLCQERVTISRDDVEIVGLGESPTVRGSLTLQGVSRVALRNFTVRDTEGSDPLSDIGDGIKVLQSQSVLLDSMTVLNTARRGISLDSSTVDLQGTLVEGATSIGVAVITSNLNLLGLNTSRNNLGTGLLAGFGSMVFLRVNAQAALRSNGQGGLSLQSNSTLVLGNEALLLSEGSPGVGLAVVSGSALTVGEGSIVSRNNGRGLVVSDASVLSSFVNSNASLSVTDNFAGGIVVFSGASALLSPGTRIVGNGGVGLAVSNATAVINGVEASGNTAGDISLSFGARATFQGGNVFGTPVLCDATVLARGAPGCQASPSAAALEASVEPTF
jgi:hypothetical protein